MQLTWVFYPSVQTKGEVMLANVSIKSNNVYHYLAATSAAVTFLIGWFCYSSESTKYPLSSIRLLIINIEHV